MKRGICVIYADAPHNNGKKWMKHLHHNLFIILLNLLSKKHFRVNISQRHNVKLLNFYRLKYTRSRNKRGNNNFVVSQLEILPSYDSYCLQQVGR